MAATVVPPDQAAQALPRKRFSREEVDEMLEAGLFAGQRYELIDGDLIDKMGQKPSHGAAIVRIQVWLASFIDFGRIQIQLSMGRARRPEMDDTRARSRRPRRREARLRTTASARR